MSTGTEPESKLTQIERLLAGEGERWRAIRLRALRDAPNAFGTTLEEALAEPSESWETQLARLATFVATAGGCDVGVARGARHDELRDTGYMLSMWVTPEARRQGIAADLIGAVVDWARGTGLRRLLLDVDECNAPAIALYLQQGFVPNGVCGTLPPPRDHLREIQMVKRL